MPRPGCSSTATGASGVEAQTVKPAGGSTTASKWLIQTGWLSGSPASSVPGCATVSIARPYSPRPVRSTRPPSCWAMSWAP